ncbi:MAG: TfoX/Sxy family protein [Alphaproteobacteria bacterium]|nr:TfoX/Sxy family protein [Alphaproteobacteria bacterium]
MAWQKSSPEVIAQFDGAVPSDSRVERRKMFGYPAAFVGGRLFASLYRDGIVLKLPAADRESLSREHGAKAFEPVPGRSMGEFLVLPKALVDDPAVLRKWLVRALDHVASLAGVKDGTARRKAGKSKSPARQKIRRRPARPG